MAIPPPFKPLSDQTQTRPRPSKQLLLYLGVRARFARMSCSRVAANVCKGTARNWRDKGAIVSVTHAEAAARHMGTIDTRPLHPRLRAQAVRNSHA